MKEKLYINLPKYLQIPLLLASIGLLILVSWWINGNFSNPSPVNDSDVLGCASQHEDVNGNFVQNSSFEDGIVGWTSGGGTITAVSNQKNSGCQSLLVSNRSETYHGPGQNLPTSSFQQGGIYEVYAYVRSASGSQSLKLTMRRNDSSTSYVGIDTETVGSGSWVQLKGTYNHQQSGSLSGMRLYIESSGTSTGDFYVDDVVMYKLGGGTGDWKADANARIEQIRKRDLQVRVVSGSGNPISGANVAITQTNNEFAFGTAININQIQDWKNGTPSSLNTYERFVVENFNWTVAESRHKWPAFEYSRDRVDFERADNLVDFSRKNGLRMRGHSLVWGVTYRDFDPPWVHALSDRTSQQEKDGGNSELEAEVMEHINAVVPRYADYLEHWDINNEMTHGNFYGIPMTARMHKRVKQLDPDVKATVNDYHVISPRSYSGGDRLDAYIQLVKNLRAAGGQVDLLGVQGHFEANKPINPNDVYYRFERLTQELGNTPIWVTEFDQDYQNKNEAADSLENLYRTAFSHRNVGGILMWGFWDGQHWRDDAAIVEQNWTVNAAGRRYQALRDEWSTEVTATTNASGVANFRGFHGDYDVRVTLPGGNVVNGSFNLASGTNDALIVTINSSGQQQTSSSSVSTSQSSSSTSTIGNPGTAYGGGVSAPGRLEAENFNEGSNGGAYYDKSAGNGLDATVTYRGGDVDMKRNANGTGYVIGLFEQGEWLHYTVEANLTADYELIAQVRSIYAGRQLRIYVDNQLEATVNVPQVGSWEEIAFSEPVNISLEEGENIIRVEMAGGNYADFDYLDLAIQDSEVTACAADYTGDSQVDAGDLSVFAQNYLRSDINCGLDLSGGDCRLDANDLSVFSAAYKKAGYCN